MPEGNSCPVSAQRAQALLWTYFISPPYIYWKKDENESKKETSRNDEGKEK
jgi:hypothetical protein